MWSMGLLYLGLAPSIGWGQPVVGSVQPDALSVGTVRVGATVEASFRMYAAGETTSGLAFKVAPPPFVKIVRTQLGTQQYGEHGTFVVLDVFLAIDTSREGNFSGKIKMQVGEVDGEFDVQARILKQEPGLTRVLIAETPFSWYSTSDATHFDAWLELAAAAKLDVHYLNSVSPDPLLRSLDLANFDVVFLEAGGLIEARPQDFEKLHTFASNGGRVVIAANHFMHGSVPKANEFIVPRGLKLIDDESTNQGICEVGPEEIADHKLTGKLKSLRFHRPSPVAVENEKSGKILVTAPTLGNHGVVAITQVDRGEVVVLGLSLWWVWISEGVATETDNGQLLKNLLSRP
jgi:hypothetical protein